MELEGQMESQQTEEGEIAFKKKNIKTLLLYKGHRVGWNRLRAGKLFRDFLQSPCFIEEKNWA